jgi:hypothetical protein
MFFAKKLPSRPHYSKRNKAMMRRTQELVKPGVT